MPSAIVTGATGITGTAIVNALIDSPEYTEIYTLSRSQKATEHPKVKHATLDLRSSVEEMSKSLAHIGTVTHVYFCAYLEGSDEAEATRINGALLSNFLEALTRLGLTRELKHFSLTCGLKQYGVHQGQPKNPMREDDDEALFWLAQPDRPPNFYYAQQRILEKHAADHNNKWTWVVTYPQEVVGFAKTNFMNLATTLGLYCAVSKELEGSQLIFPGNKINYLGFNGWTTSKLHADFCLWASKEPKAANQRFNVTNGDTSSWQDLWPRLAARFGCKIPENMFPGGDELKAYPGYESSHTKMHPRPPIGEVAAKIGLRDEFKQPSELFCQIDLVKWAKRPDVLKAWETLRDRHNLDQKAWDGATWGFVVFLLGRNYSSVASMSKARRMGWTGYVDNWDGFLDTFKELEDAKMLPPVASH